mmetsp:Transcript_80121/g.223072  ORF Transcript_80121/g.223072 Transcript_80121/m.223072 type:complete len:159 (-) Transcript_80121:146-622(-)
MAARTKKDRAPGAALGIPNPTSTATAATTKGTAIPKGVALPPTMASAKFRRRAFDMLDVGGSGALQRVEARRWLRCMGSCLPDRKLDAMLDEVVVDAFEQVQQWEQALDLMADMRKKGMLAGTQTFSCAILACLSGQEWQRALELLAELDERRPVDIA